MTRPIVSPIALLISLFASTLSGAAPITDLAGWTLLQDPPHPGMTGSVGVSGEASLLASGAVPSGTDIGYASVNGPDVAASTAGRYFDPAAAFSVAIDFDVSATGSVGAGAIGFGIGEDAAGADSAGVGLVIVNGAPTAFGTAARVADVDQPIEAFPTLPFSSGRFFVSYSPAADIVLGVNATPGAAAPSLTRSLSGLQAQWDGEPLLVSFFLRSQSAPPLAGALGAGQLGAVFSNFQVLSGTPIAVVPEVSAAGLIAWAIAGACSGRRRFGRG